MPKAHHRAKSPKDHKQNSMDKVKIHRVKRAKKSISTKEKILAGLGLGGTLLGGAGAIAPKTPSTQFVRTQEKTADGIGRNNTEQESPSIEYDFNDGRLAENKTSKIKTALKSVFGLKEAKASDLSREEMLNRISELNQQQFSGSLSSEQQQELVDLTNQYYSAGGYYEQSQSVINANTLNSDGTLGENHTPLPASAALVSGNQVITGANGQTVATVKDFNDGRGTHLILLTMPNGTSMTVNSIQAANVYLASWGAQGSLDSAGIYRQGGQSNGVPAANSTPTSTVANTGNTSGYEVWLLSDGTRMVGTDQGRVVFNPSTGRFDLINDNDQIVQAGMTEDEVNAILPNLTTSLRNPGSEAHIMNAPSVPASLSFDLHSNIDGIRYRNVSENGRDWQEANIPGLGLVAYENGRVFNDSGIDITDIFNGSQMSMLGTFFGSPYNLEGSGTGNVTTPSPGSGGGGGAQAVTATGTQTINVGIGGQSWSNVEFTNAYNSSLRNVSLSNLSNGGLRITIEGTSVTRDFSSINELNDFLNNSFKSSDNFLSLSQNERLLAVAGIQARLINPQIGLGNSNLPVPNTNTAQHVQYIDNMGNLVQVNQGVSPSGLSFMTDAQWLQSMFPGSTIVDAGYFGGAVGNYQQNPNDPTSAGWYTTTGQVNSNTNDSRRNYELVLPNGARINVGLALSNAFQSGNTTYISGLSPEQAEYFQSNSPLVQAGTITLNSTQSPSGGQSAPGTTGSQTPSAPSAGQASQAPAISSAVYQNGSIIITGSNFNSTQAGANRVEVFQGSNSVFSQSVSAGTSDRLIVPAALDSSKSYTIKITTAAGGSNTLSVAFSSFVSAQTNGTGGGGTGSASVSGAASGQTQSNISIGSATIFNNNTPFTNGRNPTLKQVSIDGTVKVAISGENFGTTTPVAATFIKGGQIINAQVISSSRNNTTIFLQAPAGNQWAVGNYTLRVTVGSGTSQVTKEFSFVVAADTSGDEIDATVKTKVKSTAEQPLIIADSSSGTQTTVDAVKDTLPVTASYDYAGNVPENFNSNASYNQNTGVYAVYDSASQNTSQTTSGASSLGASGSSVADDDVEVLSEESDSSAASNISNTGTASNTSASTNDDEVEVLNESENQTVSSTTSSTSATSSPTVDNSDGEVEVLNEEESGAASASTAATGQQGSSVSGSSTGSSYTGTSSTYGSSGSSNIQTFGNNPAPGTSSGGVTYASAGNTAGASYAQASTTYTVKKGDTLWGISKKFYGDGRQWRKIFEANLNQIKNPNVLRVGMVLVIPGVNGSSVQTFDASSSGAFSQFAGIPASGTYTIQKGDTLWDLSQRFYGNPHYWSNLQAYNAPNVNNTRALKVGTVINVPSASVLGTPGWPLPGPSSSNVQTFERQDSASTDSSASSVNIQNNDQSAAASVSNVNIQTQSLGSTLGAGVNALNTPSQASGSGAPTGANSTTQTQNQQSEQIIYKPSGSDVADDDAATGGEKLTE